MAISFIKTTIAGRTNNRNAVAMAAYRSAQKLVDLSGKVHDYTKKSGVDYSTIISPLPANPNNAWMTDRAELWNKVETSEKRYDAQLSRELVIAIPRELDRADQIALVIEHVQTSYVDRGMIADINCHHLDGDNPHAHVMLTMRDLKIDQQGQVEFGNKNRSWNDKKLLHTQKLEWDKVANQYLAKAGHDIKIDSRSYEEQGVDRIPQIHLGVAVAAMRKRGIPTNIGDEYDRIDRVNAELARRSEITATLEAQLQKLRRIEELQRSLDEQIADLQQQKDRAQAAGAADLKQQLDIAFSYSDKIYEAQLAVERQSAKIWGENTTTEIRPSRNQEYQIQYIERNAAEARLAQEIVAAKKLAATQPIAPDPTPQIEIDPDPNPQIDRPTHPIEIDQTRSAATPDPKIQIDRQIPPPDRPPQSPRRSR